MLTSSGPSIAIFPRTAHAGFYHGTRCDRAGILGSPEVNLPRNYQTGMGHGRRARRCASKFTMARTGSSFIPRQITISSGWKIV